MADLSKLTPHGIWEQFDAITKVPRPSKREHKIVKFLEDFAKEHKLDHRKDEIGNVVIVKPATSGMESKPTVVLQSHVDMVCEKNSDIEFDFDNDPIRTLIEDGWVKADGTTLGADDGIGVAAALALLVDKEVSHGAIEALFTIDEETGLTGAVNLGKQMITGKYLINLDSEDEGEVFTSCAGGVDTLAYFDYTQEPAPDGCSFVRISVSGLNGGHSGDDIEKGFGNSNRILARLLWEGVNRFGLRLAQINGGNLRNAIPREAWASAAIPQNRLTDFELFFDKFTTALKAEFRYTESGLAFDMQALQPEKVIDEKSARNLIYSLVGVANGVQAMSFALAGLVETSTNLASVKMVEGKIVVATSQRSSVESAKKAVAAAVESVFVLGGAKVEHSDGYPGWAPNPDSHLLEVTGRAYRTLFSTDIRARAIHAGLECGLFLEKYPDLEMVSIGPTVRGAHSPDERIEIATVDKFWKLLVEILKTI